MKINIFISLLICFYATACAVSQPHTGIERICDDSGCSDRPVGSYPNHEQMQEKSSADQQYDQRIAMLMEHAKRDPRAAYDLGLRLFRGDGVRQDSYRAIQWMREAAERGDLNAQIALGRLYLTGLEEMGPDFREAQKWLSLAASRGDKESKELLEEASRLRHMEDQYYRWRNRWRSDFSRRWYGGYPYQSRWRNGGWYY